MSFAHRLDLLAVDQVGRLAELQAGAQYRNTTCQNCLSADCCLNGVCLAAHGNHCLSRTCTQQLACVHKIEGEHYTHQESSLLIAVADMFEIGPISAPFGCVPLRIIWWAADRRQVNRLQTIWATVWTQQYQIHLSADYLF